MDWSDMLHKYYFFRCWFVFSAGTVTVNWVSTFLWDERLFGIPSLFVFLNDKQYYLKDCSHRNENSVIIYPLSCRSKLTFIASAESPQKRYGILILLIIVMVMDSYFNILFCFLVLSVALVADYVLSLCTCLSLYLPCIYTPCSV